MSNIGYGETIEDEKVCQTFAFGCLLRPHCIQLRSQLPKGYLRIAKTTPTHQSNSILNHTVQHPSITEYYVLTGDNTEVTEYYALTGVNT